MVVYTHEEFMKMIEDKKKPKLKTPSETDEKAIATPDGEATSKTKSQKVKKK